MARTLLVLTLLALPSAAFAQTPDSVDVGNRLVPDWSRLQGETIRIQGPDGVVEGRLGAIRGDTLILGTVPDEPEAEVWIGPTHTVQRWVKRDHSGAVTAMMGGVGMVVGGLVGRALAKPEACTRNCAILQDWEDAVDADMGLLAGALVGGLIGGLTGKAIGSSFVFEGWERATPEFSVKGFDSHRGLAVGFALRH